MYALYKAAEDARRHSMEDGTYDPEAEAAASSFMIALGFAPFAFSVLGPLAAGSLCVKVGRTAYKLMTKDLNSKPSKKDIDKYLKELSPKEKEELRKQLE